MMSVVKRFLVVFLVALLVVGINGPFVYVNAQSTCNTEPPYTKERLMRLVKSASWLERESDVDFVLGVLNDSSHTLYNTFMERAKEGFEKLCLTPTPAPSDTPTETRTRTMGPVVDYTGNVVKPGKIVVEELRNGQWVIISEQPLPTPTVTPTPTPTPSPVTATPTPTPKPDMLVAVTAPSENQTLQVEFGQTLRHQIRAQDPEGASVSYLLGTGPQGLMIDQITGMITWTPINEFFVGKKVQITVSVSDRPIGSEEWATRAVYRTFFVLVADTRPTFSPTPVPTVTPTPTPTPSPVTATPTPAPTLGLAQNPGNREQDANNQDARELEQLIEDIKKEVGKLQQELEQQNKFMVLGVVGGFAGYVYPYSGITPNNFTFSKDLWWGSRGEDVRNLQIFLNNTGCVVSTMNSGSPGNETNYFGLFTWQAVHCFQRKYANEILTSWGLDSTESTGYFGTTSRIKANQLLAEARVKRLQPIFEGGIIEPWSCQGCDRLSPEERQEETKRVEGLLTEFAISYALGPVGVVGKAGLPVGKVVLSTLKQKGGQVLNLIRIAPSKALLAANEFMAMMRLVPKLSKEAIEYLAEHPGDMLKLAQMVDKYGTEVLQYIRHKGFNPALLNDHYTRHAGRIGVQSLFEYELLAKKFLNRPTGGTLLTRIRPNGEIVRFDIVTERFGVKASNGTIKTFYKPNPAIHGYRTNLDYFLAQ